MSRTSAVSPTPQWAVDVAAAGRKAVAARAPAAAARARRLLVNEIGNRRTSFLWFRSPEKGAEGS
jgi:hypothetical protein